ncbi:MULTISPECIES: porin family protein [Aquimarina]|uniref:PorT family protein n=1 Tax=Aquimarina algiphila TaxID=2047982 RepID=A0A554VBX4_9FLAO|nr:MULTISPECIES: porin family protein [Aquimarina]TSE04123.1 PorT family protein [Aquimarina algiphila]
MKKLFLLAIAVISFSVSSNAQDIKFGFKGGVNFATLNGDDVNDNLDGRTGYHIGAVLQVSLAETIALQPELLYSAQGIEDTDIDYLNLPVLVKLKFAKIFSVEAGPQFGFVVNDDFEVGDPESFDLSGAVGAGVEFGPFFGQLRYNFGFTDVIDNVEAKNSAFQISVGYYIF